MACLDGEFRRQTLSGWVRTKFGDVPLLGGVKSRIRVPSLPCAPCGNNRNHQPNCQSQAACETDSIRTFDVWGHGNRGWCLESGISESSAQGRLGRGFGSWGGPGYRGCKEEQRVSNHRIRGITVRAPSSTRGKGWKSSPRHWPWA